MTLQFRASFFNVIVVPELHQLLPSHEGLGGGAELVQKSCMVNYILIVAIWVFLNL